MKKPFLLLKTKKDKAKLLLCLAMCAFAISLFFNADAKLVFADTSNKCQSLYSLLGRLL